MEFTIRKPHQEDFEQWLSLWDGYNEFYGRSGDKKLDPLISRTTWSRFFDVYEPVHAIVAEENGMLIGLSHYLYHRSTITVEPNCYLQDVFVSQEFRGRGVARKLIEAVYDLAKTNGCSRVYWQTQETNHTARQLYDKLAERSGFIVYRKQL
ncbi:GNAT family N-acetyltransferase [Chitinophaga varians]|uniref:GNAT family N-acetyltransferase n=1 Tax=Chitinophaga varians TaxID=2202339 RepID=UPI00165F7BB3|nr:GNAT family N-acetyltransferase [Chitinophaga varians]MBC9909330.1 GNAT family N-acetyltransferase [Chitinophaga varians]